MWKSFARVGVSSLSNTWRRFKSDKAFEDIVSRVKPGILMIISDFSDRSSAGGAFMVAKNLAVACLHQVCQYRFGKPEIGRVYVASVGGEHCDDTEVQVVATYPAYDLVLLELPDVVSAKLIFSLEDRVLSAGASIFTMGHPIFLRFALRKGIVSIPRVLYSSFSADFKNHCSIKYWESSEDLEMIEMDINLGLGFSGTPVFDSEGNIIGIVQSGQGEFGQGEFEGYTNFAVPVKYIKDIVKAYTDKQLVIFYAKLDDKAAALARAIAYIPLTVLSVPAPVLSLGSGYLFWLPVGAVADSIGATLGATAAFLLGRTTGRSYVISKLKKYPKFQAVAIAIQRSGFKLVPFTPFPLGEYMLASWVGSMVLKVAFEVFCNKQVFGCSSVELLASLCDNILKTGGNEKLNDEAIEETLDKVVKLLVCLSDKDFCAEFYRKKISGRLPFHMSGSDDHERMIPTNLKQQCAGQFKSKMEGVVIDWTLAKENQCHFEEYLGSNPDANPGIDFSVTVLTTGFWPTYKSSDLRHPAEMVVFIREVIELHNKYFPHMNDCFGNHSLFQKAMKVAFEVFCDKQVFGCLSAELLASFCDNILKKGGNEKLSDEAIEETLDKVVKLLVYLSDKDLFAEFYRKKLSGRLPFHMSGSDDHERMIPTNLKQQCAGQFKSKMEGVFTDWTLAKENQCHVEDYLGSNPNANPGIAFFVTILTSGFWPTYKSSDLRLPAEMVKFFEEFYQMKTKHRKLTRIYSFGTCLNSKFVPKPIELIVVTYQAAALSLFNQSDRLSYSEIRTQLNLSDDDLVRLLQSLSCDKYKILIKEPNTETVTSNDYFEFNSQFTDRMRRIRIPLPPVDERKTVVEDVDKDRRYSIVTALMPQLVMKCVEQLHRMFKPDFKAIKKWIEDLIARDYLERDKGNTN